MENLKGKRKELMEKDILNLLEGIQGERANFKKICIEKEKYCDVKYEKITNKNYSDYRKLSDSLKKLIDTYKRFDRDNYNEKYMKSLVDELNKEINEVHVLMSNALERNSQEQYRCLNDVYIKLVELVDSIERSVPVGLGGIKIKLSQESIDNIERVKDDFIKELENVNLVKNPLDYYKSYTTIDGKMKYTKTQVKEIVEDSDKFYQLLKENDIPYIYDVFYRDILEGSIPNIEFYFKHIFSLPQYRDLRWKDSVFAKLEDSISTKGLTILNKDELIFNSNNSNNYIIVLEGDSKVKTYDEKTYKAKLYSNNILVENSDFDFTIEGIGSNHVYNILETTKNSIKLKYFKYLSSIKIKCNLKNNKDIYVVKTIEIQSIG